MLAARCLSSPSSARLVQFVTPRRQDIIHSANESRRSEVKVSFDAALLLVAENDASLPPARWVDR